MTHLDNGQCGLCTHFGETHDAGAQLNQIQAKVMKLQK